MTRGKRFRPPRLILLLNDANDTNIRIGQRLRTLYVSDSDQDGDDASGYCPRTYTFRFTRATAGGIFGDIRVPECLFGAGSEWPPGEHDTGTG